MKTVLKNEPMSAITHLVAALLSIAGLVLMLVFAAKYGRASHIVGCAVFGASLIILYCTSTLYHFFPQETKIKKIFQRLDHAMIFVLIAGSYTPLTLIMPQRGWGWSIFGIIWGIAVIGIVIKSVGVRMKGWLTVLIYIIMGWLAIIAVQPLMQWLGFATFKWLLIGGILYTLGCIFFALDKIVPRTRWFGMHEIFHLFVIAGSFCHFWLMLMLLNNH